MNEMEGMGETSQLHGGFSPSLQGSVAEPFPRARLVVISKDGGEGPSYPVGETLDIGRSEGNVTIHEDRYLSSRHARIGRRPEGRTGGGSSPPQPRTRLVLKDLGSANGVFLRLRPREASANPPGAHAHPVPRDSRPDDAGGAPPTASLAHPLRDQDLFLVGQQVLRFEVVNDADEGLGPASQHGTLLFGSPATPRYARLCQRTVEGVTRDVFYIRKAETVLGRESGDIVFTEDPFLSRRHASLRVEKDPRRFLLTDLGSSNGTFVQIRGEIALENGDQFRVGQQLFRIDIG
jgi:pSer/pThr/pTyr-binding forkhead associated (FHA) protein